MFWFKLCNSGVVKNRYFIGFVIVVVVVLAKIKEEDNSYEEEEVEDKQYHLTKFLSIF